MQLFLELQHQNSFPNAMHSVDVHQLPFNGAA